MVLNQILLFLSIVDYGKTKNRNGRNRITLRLRVLISIYTCIQTKYNLRLMFLFYLKRLNKSDNVLMFNSGYRYLYKMPSKKLE